MLEMLEERTLLNAAPTANEQYVSGLFAELLNRAPSSSELSSYSARLDGSVSTRVPVALELMNSSDFATAAVQNAFSSLLHRQAEPGAISGFSKFLERGGTLAQLDALVTGSAEYFMTRGNGTNQGFLNAAYQDALARSPDPLGQASFIAALNAGTSRSAVATFIYSSSEFQSDWIAGLYGHFSDRAPTSDELQASLTTLHAAGEKSAIAGIVANGSSYGVLSNHANSLYVTEMYRDLLRRDPDTSSLKLWEAGLDSGTTTPVDVAHAILVSPEYDGIIVDGIYNQYLGRTADPGGKAFFVGMLAAGTTPEQVAADIAGSPEFLQSHTAGTQQGFLQEFYQDTFAAPLSSADPALISKLNLDLSPEKLAMSIFKSAQYQDAAAQSISEHFLGRLPMPSEIAHDAALISSPGGDSLLITTIMTSREYQGLDPAAAVRSGTFTFQLLGQTQVMLQQAIDGARSVMAASSGAVNNAALITSLQAFQQDTSSLQQFILPLMLGQAQTAALGVSGEGVVSINDADLSETDKLALQVIDQQSSADAYLQQGQEVGSNPNATFNNLKTILLVGGGALALGGAALESTPILVGGGILFLAGVDAQGVAAGVQQAENLIRTGKFDLPSQQEINNWFNQEIQGAQNAITNWLANTKNGVVNKFKSLFGDEATQSRNTQSESQQQTIEYNDNASEINHNLPANPPTDTAPSLRLPQPDLNFDATQGGANPSPQQISIANAANNDSKLNPSLTADNPEIIDLSKVSIGAVGPGDTNTENVSVDTKGLQSGTYRGGIVVSDPNSLQRQEFVPVTITIAPPGNIPPQVGAAFQGGQAVSGVGSSGGGINGTGGGTGGTDGGNNGSVGQGVFAGSYNGTFDETDGTFGNFGNDNFTVTLNGGDLSGQIAQAIAADVATRTGHARQFTVTNLQVTATQIRGDVTAGSQNGDFFYQGGFIIAPRQ